MAWNVATCVVNTLVTAFNRHHEAGHGMPVSEYLYNWRSCHTVITEVLVTVFVLWCGEATPPNLSLPLLIAVTGVWSGSGLIVGSLSVIMLSIYQILCCLSDRTWNVWQISQMRHRCYYIRHWSGYMWQNWSYSLPSYKQIHISSAGHS